MRNFGVMTGSLLCLGVLGFADVDVRDQPQYNQNPGSPTTNIYIDENKNNDGFPLEPYPLFWGGAPFLWGGIWYNSYDDWNHGYNNYYNYDYHPNEAAQDQRIQNRGDNQENRINNRGANQQGRIDNRGDWDRGGDDRGDGGGRSGGGGRGGGGGGGGRGGR